MLIKAKTVIIIAVIIALIVFLAIALKKDLVVREYEVKSEKVKEDFSMRIVVISDLHSYVYGENQSVIIDKIKAQNPDIILLPGDIVDDVEPIEGAEIFLKRIVELAPTYYVTGNHEFWSKKPNEIKDMIEGYGVVVLENEKSSFEFKGQTIELFGIDDPDVFMDDEYIDYTNHKTIISKMGIENNENWNLLLESIWDDTDEESYKILLSHRPGQIDEYKKYKYDIIVSGHAHGGQVRIPGLVNGLFAPNQGFFPKYAGGLYEYGVTKHVVSRGVSYNQWLPRVFNPPEIVVVEVRGSK